MKNSKKAFLLTEGILGCLVLILALAMLQDKNGKTPFRISVIIENSEDKQWAAFRYGLRMAAEDQQAELSIVTTEGTMTLEEEEELIQQEISNGADGLILQPVPGLDTEEILKKTDKRVPVMLVDSSAVPREKEALPVTSPDNYALGKALAEELIQDCGNNLQGKSIGILYQNEESQAVLERKAGLEDRLAGSGIRTSWWEESAFGGKEEDPIKNLSKVDFMMTLDDSSTTAAGEHSAANDLHGAIVYGIGTSTESAYYLDTGKVQCLVVPDEFNVGYQSLEEMARKLSRFFGKMEGQQTAHTVIRRDTLFTKENQDILFTMSQ